MSFVKATVTSTLSCLNPSGAACLPITAMRETQQWDPGLPSAPPISPHYAPWNLGCSGCYLFRSHLFLCCPLCLKHCPSCSHSLLISNRAHSHSQFYPSISFQWDKLSPSLRLYLELASGKYSRFPWQPCWFLSLCPTWSRLWFAFYCGLLLYSYPVTLNNRCDLFEDMISIYGAPVMGYFHSIFTVTLWSRG